MVLVCNAAATVFQSAYCDLILELQSQHNQAISTVLCFLTIRFAIWRLFKVQDHHVFFSASVSMQKASQNTAIGSFQEGSVNSEKGILKM